MFIATNPVGQFQFTTGCLDVTGVGETRPALAFDIAGTESVLQEILLQLFAQQSCGAALAVGREAINPAGMSFEVVSKGNGALLPGRTRSSFVFEPNWRSRPWPPRDKYGPGATDAELGLI